MRSYRRRESVGVCAHKRAAAESNAPIHFWISCNYRPYVLGLRLVRRECQCNVG